MTSPDKTNSSKPKKRTRERPVRSTNNGRSPAVRTVHEDVESTDTPLYRVEPDRNLQHRALLWVGLALIAALATACVVAIAVGSVPTALVTAIAILATTIMLIVQRVFPKSDMGSER